MRILVDFSTYEKILREEKINSNHDYIEKIVGKRAPGLLGVIFGETEYHYHMHYYNQERLYEIHVNSTGTKSKYLIPDKSAILHNSHNHRYYATVVIMSIVCT